MGYGNISDLSLIILTQTLFKALKLHANKLYDVSIMLYIYVLCYTCVEFQGNTRVSRPIRIFRVTNFYNRPPYPSRVQQCSQPRLSWIG